MMFLKKSQYPFGLNKIFRISCLLSSIMTVLLPGTVVATPASYDFSVVGNVGSDGFRHQGDKFLLDERFVNNFGSTYMYVYPSPGNTTSVPLIIKADNINLAAFDLNDMSFSVYTGAGNDTITSMIITGTLRTGGTVSYMVSNQTLTSGTAYSLSGWGANLVSFTDVTQLSFNITMAKDVSNLNFETITIDNPISTATLTATHIYSSNTNSTRAMVGDTITLEMTSSVTISAPSVTIAGHSVGATGSGTAWTATYTMASGDTEGQVGFTINYSDTNGYAGLPVNGPMASDESSVIFDRTAPTLNSAIYVNSTSIDVTFSEEVSGATNTANYFADNDLSIYEVLHTGGNTYRLTTSYPNTLTLYTITASNITDIFGNPLSSGNTATVMNSSSIDGDLNDDGKVDDADVGMAMRFAAGLDDPISIDYTHGDVAPLVNGIPHPEGSIDIGDVVMILRKARKLANW